MRTPSLSSSNSLNFLLSQKRRAGSRSALLENYARQRLRVKSHGHSGTVTSTELPRVQGSEARSNKPEVKVTALALPTKRGKKRRQENWEASCIQKAIYTFRHIASRQSLGLLGIIFWKRSRTRESSAVGPGCGPSGPTRAVRTQRSQQHWASPADRHAALALPSPAG